MDLYLNIKANIMKLPEENIIGNLGHLGVGNDFLDETQKHEP